MADFVEVEGKLLARTRSLKDASDKKPEDAANEDREHETKPKNWKNNGKNGKPDT